MRARIIMASDDQRASVAIIQRGQLVQTKFEGKIPYGLAPFYQCSPTPLLAEAQRDRIVKNFYANGYSVISEEVHN